MNRMIRPGGLTLMAMACLTAAPVQFERDILPIFEANCTKCHSGPKAQASLDVRSRGALLKGGMNGPSVVLGSAAKSSLYVRVANGEMPLGGKPLAPAEVELIKTWIDTGAAAAEPQSTVVVEEKKHWAFTAPRRPSVPAVRARGRVRNPIDAFVLSRLERDGLTLSADASRATLLRRVTFDLTGLPPTPEELETFLADKSPRAYETVVDRLLASPHYGERWSRQWLDAAGYAESEGVLAADVVRPDAWRYRDYVIRAFNNDKPYDRFVREQLAGDEISEFYKQDRYTPETVDALEATGFLRTAVDATRDDFLPKDFAEYNWRTFFDTEQIAVSALMGLTIQCARCHNHKYEPIAQRDYYAVQAIFAGAIRPNGPVLPGMKRSVVNAPLAERERAKKVNEPLDGLIKALTSLQAARLTQYRTQHPKGEMATEKELREAFPEYARKADEAAAELKDSQSKRIDLPTIRAMTDQDGEAPVTFVLKRGDPLSPGDPVEPDVPGVLKTAPVAFQVPPAVKGAKTTGRRRAFAEWITQPAHPLTARVMVNRVWSGHFGRGIVATLDNFGKSGAPPTNPELLDWLATEFVRQGWSLKSLHKLIVTSAVYRQAATPNAQALAKDPENLLLWRMTPRRLEAEAVRDAVLAASGSLDKKMFGEPVKTETKPSGEVVPVGDSAEGRRSAYMTVRRSAPQSLLNAFDAPVMEVNCTRRVTSTSATQALALMNGEFVTAQAKYFARGVLHQSPEDDSAAVTQAFLRALGRKPTSTELDTLLTFLKKQSSFYADKPQEQRERVFADLCQALLSANEFVYID